MQDMRYKCFTIIVIVSILSFLAILLLKGLPSALVLLAGIAIILFITRGVWRRPINKYYVRVFSLIIALSTVMSYGFWQNLLDAVVKTYFPDIAGNFQYAPPIFIVAFIGCVIWIVNYYNRDNTAMGKHPNSIEKTIPNIFYEKEIKGVAESLSDGLRSIDIQTNWSSQYFTPLDAEVEVIKGTRRKKKIMDLLSAIKKSDDRLFLVLGDPGSGKSVSLRKLCQDLSKETKKTGKIPIYVNLKEWQIDEKWNQDNPPTTENLMNFVLANVGKRDVFVNKFFNREIDGQTYFERLYLTGHLFFVFDSFDEIPSVLNEDENSWLIKELSKVIFTFLKGARENSSQGILSSRLFRKPTQEFQCTTTLEIRPFSEKKIIKTFERNGNIESVTIKDFFKNRSHLVPIARNPFTATLISEYIEFNNGALPKTHAELYENYLNQLLDNCKDQMKKKSISKEQIISFAKVIAASMSKSNQGWEIETQILRDIDTNAEKCIDILKFARIGRGNTGDESVFSFVHRRFAEYFMAKNMLDNKDAIDLQAIPKDSQLRDALVLYCEIADDETATKIADFCWEIISINNLQNIEVIHALRFLRDAFKGRKECLKNFNAQLAQYMAQQITSDNDMLSVKIIVECISLLDYDNMDKNLLSALQLNNYWITETAFYSCRNIPNLSQEILSKFEIFFTKIPIDNLLQSYSEYKFSLSLSESFKNVLFWVKFRLFDFIIFLLALICISVVYPRFALILISAFISAFLVCSLLSLAFGFVFRFENTIIRLNLSFMIFLPVFISDYRSINSHELKYFISESINNYELKYFVVLILLCQIVYPISLICKKMSKQSIIHFIKSMGISKIATCISGYTVLMVIVNVLIEHGLMELVGIFFGVLFGITAIISFAWNIYKYYSDYKHLKKIDFQKCNSRDIIYKQFTSFKNNNMKLKYVNLLELHVHNVSGNWPSKDIFEIKNISESSNSANIRLAQLEEKWLGINR
ncbi:MAG: NACHT domain-containing protein [Tannerella sp.]|jgi:hypothetical protein|nr:NACHT domain-containing protein [Tannerella sp.]